MKSSGAWRRPVLSSSSESFMVSLGFDGVVCLLVLPALTANSSVAALLANGTYIAFRDTRMVSPEERRPVPSSWR